MLTTKKILLPEVNKAIRDSLCLENNVPISRHSRLNDLCGEKLDSSDILTILSNLGINPRDYLHDESIDKNLLKYVIQEEETQLPIKTIKELYDPERKITPTDIFPYITAGHIQRATEFDCLPLIAINKLKSYNLSL